MPSDRKRHIYVDEATNTTHVGKIPKGGVISDPIKELRELVKYADSDEYVRLNKLWMGNADEQAYATITAKLDMAREVKALLPALEQRERFEIPELSRVIAYKLANSGALNADPNAINCVAIPIIERELRAALNL
jgi:hypothetical protein